MFQLIGVIVGLVWGILALQGALGLVGFAAINAGLVIYPFSYSVKALQPILVILIAALVIRGLGIRGFEYQPTDRKKMRKKP